MGRELLSMFWGSHAALQLTSLGFSQALGAGLNPSRTLAEISSFIKRRSKQAEL